MRPDPNEYLPICCDHHDLLESFAMARTSAYIRFLDAEGVEQRRTACITDVFAHEGSEFLRMSTGETVRLDRLLGINEFDLGEN